MKRTPRKGPFGSKQGAVFAALFAGRPPAALALLGLFWKRRSFAHEGAIPPTLGALCFGSPQGPANVDAICLLAELGAEVEPLTEQRGLETPLHVAARSGRQVPQVLRPALGATAILGRAFVTSFFGGTALMGERCARLGYPSRRSCYAWGCLGGHDWR